MKRLRLSSCRTIRKLWDDQTFYMRAGLHSILLKDLRSNLLLLILSSHYSSPILGCSTLTIKNIVNNLYEIGYEKETLVTKPGEFGLRGFILDIFPLNEENPIRIEFFGDTIESIRCFEVESQKSLENIDEIEIYSISKTSEKYSSLYEYLNNPLVIFKDYSQIKISYERIMNDIFELNIENPLYDINDIDEKKINYYFDSDDDTSLAKKVVNFNIKNVERFNSNVEIINKYLEESLKFNKTVIICLSTINVNNFIEILNIPYLLTDIVNIKENNISANCFSVKCSSNTSGRILGSFFNISHNPLRICPHVCSIFFFPSVFSSFINPSECREKKPGNCSFPYSSLL